MNTQVWFFREVCAVQKGFHFQLNLINTSRYAADAHLLGMEGLHVGDNISLILTDSGGKFLGWSDCCCAHFTGMQK